MSQYIVLKNIRVQNVNAIAGFTWGYPAITHFLGFTHALSRKLETQHQIRLTGCGVVSHDHQVHTYKPYHDFRFIQQKCPPRVKGKDRNGNEKAAITPPVIEEGKMNLTCSLLILVDDDFNFSGSEADRKHFENSFKTLCYQHRLAGGIILDIQSIRLYSEVDDKKDTLNKIKRELMPGFVLMDRSQYLEEHFTQLQKENKDAELLDAWLDFSAIKYEAIPIIKKGEEITEDTKADWVMKPKPFGGWLVPIMTGYKAISEVYEAGEVANVRDPEIPACFVESVHSIGEWLGAYRLKQISDCIWQYTHEEGWYLCQQVGQHQTNEDESLKTDLINFIENL